MFGSTCQQTASRSSEAWSNSCGPGFDGGLFASYLKSVELREEQMRNFLLAIAAIALANLVGIAGLSAATADGQNATIRKPPSNSGCGVGWQRNPQGRCVPK